MSKDIEVYTLEEVTELLHVTRRTLYNWIEAGKLKAFKAGLEWRVEKSDLEAYIEQQKNAPRVKRKRKADTSKEA